MNNEDINGTRAKSLYRGVAKDILNNRDIDGSSPKFEKVSYLKHYNFIIVETETI